MARFLYPDNKKIVLWWGFEIQQPSLGPALDVGHPESWKIFPPPTSLSKTHQQRGEENQAPERDALHGPQSGKYEVTCATQPGRRLACGGTRASEDGLGWLLSIFKTNFDAVRFDSMVRWLGVLVKVSHCSLLSNSQTSTFLFLSSRVPWRANSQRPSRPASRDLSTKREPRLVGTD